MTKPFVRFTRPALLAAALAIAGACTGAAPTEPTVTTIEARMTGIEVDPVPMDTGYIAPGNPADTTGISNGYTTIGSNTEQMHPGG